MILVTPCSCARAMTWETSSRKEACVRLAPMSITKSGTDHVLPPVAVSGFYRYRKRGLSLISLGLDGELAGEAADVAQGALVARGPRLADAEAHAVAVALRRLGHRCGRDADTALNEPL